MVSIDTTITGGAAPENEIRLQVTRFRRTLDVKDSALHHQANDRCPGGVSKATTSVSG
jgi:hypothetical protein